jgi:D-xylose transport system permease protein
MTDLLPADLADERLVKEKGLVGVFQAFGHRVRGGELGSLPVIVGLIVISLVFYAQDATFLSSRTLVNITLFAAPIGIIAIGVVLVLLLGEIDLSVGSVSGLAASVMAVMIVYHGQSLVLSIAAGLGVGLAIGVGYSLLFTRVGVPSFVITLAGLLGFLGLQLVVLGKNGTVNLPSDSALLEFARASFLSPVASYVLVAVVTVIYGLTQVLVIRRRTAADLSAPSYTAVGIRTALMAIGLGYLAYYLNIDRGIGYLPLLFVVLVVVMDLLLRRSRWGRHVFAVGGNEEAARRSGIRVNLVYMSVFALTGFFSALGGILAAAQLTSVSQASGGTDTNLTAIAAAVIGGTSLFGGRGTAYAALLGIVVLQSIQTGLNVIGVDSSVRYMVTGAVLLLAVSIDSVSRRARSSSGRG